MSLKAAFGIKDKDLNDVRRKEKEEDEEVEEEETEESSKNTDLDEMADKIEERIVKDLKPYIANLLTANQEKPVEKDILYESLKTFVSELNTRFGWLDDEALENTPKRILLQFNNMYNLRQSGGKINTRKAKNKDIFIKRNILASSVEVKYLNEIEYSISIGFIPNEFTLSPSEMDKLVNYVTSKPSRIEEMGSEIITLLDITLSPESSICKIKEFSKNKTITEITAIGGTSKENGISDRLKKAFYSKE